jgi:GTP-binding protein YchF
MKIGLFGFAGSGKTSVFNLLTGLKADTGGGMKTKANLGVTKVPDARVDVLSKIYATRKTVYAEIQFSDMPGQAPTKTSGGLSSQVIGDLRPMDVLVLVLRDFENPALDAPPDPLRDYQAMAAELLLADLPLVEKRVERFQKEKATEQEKEVLRACLAHLESEQPLRTLQLREDQWALVRGYRFLSEKQLIVLVNTPEGAPTRSYPELEQKLAASGIACLKLCASIENEILELDPADRKAFLADLGVMESGRERFIQEAYRALDLISFLTAGQDECRAWTITRGTSAQRAAGKVHSDIERGFIRAEVVAYDDFAKAGSESAAKAANKYRLEGKEYVVKDGDIIEYRFNV